MKFSIRFPLFNEATDNGGGGGNPNPAPAPAFREQVFQADGSFSPDWHAHLGDEFKDAAPQLSRFKSFPDLVKSHLHGQRQLSQARPAIPDETSTPEQVKAFRDFLQLPEDEKAWDIGKPDKLPEGVEWNENLAKEVSAWARANHISPKAIPSLVEKFNSIMGEQGKASKEQFDANSLAVIKADEEALKKEWGADHGKNMTLAKRAAATAGLPAEHYALTDKDVLKAFHKLAVATGESRLVAGQENNMLTGDPATQARLIQTDKTNPHYAAYHNAQDPNHKTVRGMVLQMLQQG